MKLIGIQFRTSLLLVATAIIAGLLGGYHWGGILRDREILDAKVVAITYNLNDFVPRGANLEAMTELRNFRDFVVKTIGPTEIPLDDDHVHLFPSNRSIIVQTDGKTHREISTLLQKLRRLMLEAKTSKVKTT